MSVFIEEKSRILKDVEVVVEIGSRWGEDSIRLKTLFPNAKVYSFECTPSSIVLWKSLVKHEDNILIEKAVCDFTGETKFYVNDRFKTITDRYHHPDGNQGANSLFHANLNLHGAGETYIQNEITVPCTTIKDWAEENNIKKIDVLWMDAQGAELQALKSMGDLLQTIQIIHTEVEFFEVYLKQPLFKDVNTYLESCGFEFINFENKGTATADANYVKGNKVTEITLKIFYGGLGDHLLYSPFPRIAKQIYGFDKVFISNHSNYNNPATKKLVWKHNPFVDDFGDGDSDYPKFGKVLDGKNILDTVADFFGLSSDTRFLEKPLFIIN